MTEPMLVAPSITRQPAAVSVEETQTAQFTVEASGDGLTYQWLRDAMPITAATGATLTLPMVSAFDDGARFSVRVQNAAGAVVSTEALLTVTLRGVPVSADGGTVSSPDGLITLTLPRGAVTADGTLRFRPVEAPSVPADAGYEDFAEAFPRRSWELELTGAEFAAGPGFGVIIAAPDPMRTGEPPEPSETAVIRLCPGETPVAIGGNGGLCGAVVSATPCTTNTAKTTISLQKYVPIYPRPGATYERIGRSGDDTIRRTLGGQRWSAIVWDRRNTDPQESFVTIFRTNGEQLWTIALAPEEDPIAYDGLGTFAIRIGRREGVSTSRCELSLRTLRLSYTNANTVDGQMVVQLARTYPSSPGCMAPSTGIMTRQAFFGTNLNRAVRLALGKVDSDWALPPQISANFPRVLAQAGPLSPLWVMGMSTMGCPNPCPFIASADVQQAQPTFSPAIRLGDGRGVRTSPGGYRLAMTARIGATVWATYGATERTTSSPSYAGRIMVVGVDGSTNQATSEVFLPGSDSLEPAGMDVDDLGRPVVVTTFGPYADGAQNDQGVYAYRLTPTSPMMNSQTFRLRDMSASPGSAYAGGQNRGGGWLGVDGAVVSVSIDLGMTGIPNEGCANGSPSGCGDLLVLRTKL